MGVRILEGDDNAVLYCSSSDWAFGPLFDNGEKAQDFLDWLDSYFPPELDLNALGKIRWRHDPRELTDQGLQNAHCQWLSARDNTSSAEEAAYDDMRETMA